MIKSFLEIADEIFNEANKLAKQKEELRQKKIGEQIAAERKIEAEAASRAKEAQAEYYGGVSKDNENTADEQRRSKEDEEFLNEARHITYLIQQNHIGYSTLWNKISALSIKDIKKTYDRLNTRFDLWEGERDSFQYVPEMFDLLKNKISLVLSMDK